MDDEEKDVVDTRKHMEFYKTFILPNGRVVDVYKVGEGLFRLVFRREVRRDKKDEGGDEGYTLVPEG